MTIVLSTFKEHGFQLREKVTTLCYNKCKAPNCLHVFVLLALEWMAFSSGFNAMKKGIKKENSTFNHLRLPFSSSYELECGQNNYSIYCGEVNIPQTKPSH